MTHPHPAERVRWITVDSTAVLQIGWDGTGRMYIRFKNPLAGSKQTLYAYEGVSRQRIAACLMASSVGSYVAKQIVPRYPAVRLP
jgi:KTSC domain